MTMVHEICHDLSFQHCIYYECTMNGTRGEHTGDNSVGLCPICLKKLKFSIEFNTIQRYLALIEACESIGFQKEANFYK